MIHAIAELGFEAYSFRQATYMRRRVPERVGKRVSWRTKQVRKEYPLFPGYVFVLFDPVLDDWAPLATADGVRRLFATRSGVPLPVRRGVIEQVIARADAQGGCIDPRWRPDKSGPATCAEPGDQIRVLDGPFTSFTGRCVSAGMDTATFLLWIFGRETQDELSAGQFDIV